jgi:RNA polymerase sigma-70 factor (ECF subfamily)
MEDKEPVTLEAVFPLVYKRCCNFANQYLQDQDAAKDIVSTVILRLLENPREFPNFKALLGFLMCDIRNQSLNYLRRGRMIEAHQSRVAAHFYPDSREEDGQDALLTIQLFKVINKAAENLAPRTGLVIRLTKEGLDTYGIAATMGIAPQTVRNFRISGINNVKKQLFQRENPITSKSPILSR